MDTLLSRNLPKWPQMLTVGKPVAVDQAKEVIRRTDEFFRMLEYSGNNRDYASWVMETLGIPTHATHDDVPAMRAVFDAQAEWRDAWGFVETAYVHNSWIACAYIHGPHGWMRPDGSILFIDNVGKWPAVSEVLQDWKTLAREFPFVTLDSVLMDREYSEDGRQPVVGFHVEDGKVRVFDPAGETALMESMFTVGDAAIRDQPFLPSEQGIPRSWIEEWGRSRKAGKP